MSNWTKPGPRQGCELAAERVYDLIATQGESRYGPITDAIAEETQAPALWSLIYDLAHSGRPLADMVAEAREITSRLEARP